MRTLIKIEQTSEGKRSENLSTPSEREGEKLGTAVEAKRREKEGPFKWR